ncbi:hypothetical protein, partial [Mastigocoleus sp. MO_188.B34]|uniref:hypothetical protein n=1 Tax=Mastigocoleus sp. MO_188.B34 TaxID=3036635 RepID=UPI0026109591
MEGIGKFSSGTCAFKRYQPLPSQIYATQRIIPKYGWYLLKAQVPELNFPIPSMKSTEISTKRKIF